MGDAEMSRAVGSGAGSTAPEPNPRAGCIRGPAGTSRCRRALRVRAAFAVCVLLLSGTSARIYGQPDPPAKAEPAPTSREPMRSEPAPPAGAPSVTAPALSLRVPQPEATTVPQAGSSADAGLMRLLGSRKQELVAGYKALARRAMTRGQRDVALRELAKAYAMQPDDETLLALAAVCRKSDLDAEALLLYKRLLSAVAEGPQRADIEEAIAALQARLESSELIEADVIRSYTARAKQGFQDSRFPIAAQEMAVSYALKRLPRILFNIAQSYRRGERLGEAYVMYARFLEEEPQGPLRKETLGYLAELRPVAFPPPIYKRPWLWGIVGTAAALLIAGSVGLGVALKPKDPATDGGEVFLRFSLSRRE